MILEKADEPPRRQGRQEKSITYQPDGTRPLGEMSITGKSMKIHGVLGVLAVQIRFLG